MAVKNGGIIGPANTHTGGRFGVAKGVWRLADAINFTKNGTWPTVPTPVTNTCRFDDGSSDYLNRTGGTATDGKKFTYSAWFKRANLGGSKELFCIYADNTNRLFLRNNGDTFELNMLSGFGSTTREFRDTSAWYHFVIACDSTQVTASDRGKWYLNGELIMTGTISLNQVFPHGQSTPNFIIGNGEYNNAIYSNYWDGYMAEVCFIDGQQLDPSYFGETNAATGIWVAKPIDNQVGSFGNNGFFLDFSDSSNLGKDLSPNGNDFTVNNLTSIDQTTDTPVNSYATYNPLMNKPSGVPTMSNGNLTLTTNSEEFGSVSSIGVNQGKWYCELKWDSGLYAHIGITGDPITLSSNSTAYAGITADSWGWNYGGSVQNNNSIIATYSSFATSDILGIALDLDNNKLYFSKNGTWQNSADPSAGTNGISITGASSVDEGNYFIFIGNGSSAGNATLSANFGNPPYSISSGNSDANGYGNFEYAVPSGYYALNSANLNTYG